MRINQIARKHGLENKDILDYLESIGVQGKSHSSSLDDGTTELLLQHFGKLETKEPETSPPANSRFAKIRRPKGWKPPEPAEKKEAPPPLPEAIPVVSTPVEEITAPSAVAAVPPAEPPEMIEPPAPPVIEESVEAPAVETPLSETVPAEEETVSAEEAIKREIRKLRKEKIAEPKGKKEKKTVKKEAVKKAKPKTISLETLKKSKGEADIIIEAPELDLESLQEHQPAIEPIFEEPIEKELPRRHDEDEAIRREIQKLKIKQSRSAAEISKVKPADEPTAAIPRPAGPRRPTVVKTKGKRAWKREKRERREMMQAAEMERHEREKTILKVHDASTVADVASGLGIPPSELIQKLISLGVMATINQPIEFETIQIIADEYNFAVEKIDLKDSDALAELWEEDTDESRKVFRPPVVTVMGHVDHGKTKLLDAVRQADVASHEAGGITQHIGAYYVNTPGGDIVFLDTPGHAAFTAMRARGAMVTDIVVLVVAASEGVMPQTIEAINHAKAAGVPIIVALNKIDLEGANPDRVKQQLAEQGLVPEEWGGKTVVVPISALKKIGIEDLLESILLQAEMLELKADPACRARGVIIEGRLEQGRGPVATALIQQGTLRIGDPFVAGIYAGRIRAMLNDKGETVETAGPSMPVEILGIESVPSAGDPFIVAKDDNQARQISVRLQQIQRERELNRARNITLEDLSTQVQQGAIKELRLIVKGDVQGSVQALCDSLKKIESDKVRIEILHSAVGAITESDVMLAAASNAIILGFNVRPYPHVIELAKQEHVDIRTYRVIYDAISDVTKAMTGMLEKTYEERILGHGEVREVFRVSRSMSIAGLYIQDGRIIRNAPIRLLRDSVVVHEGRMASLKRFKDDVREVQSGYECGIGLENFNDIKHGDVVECYMLEEVAPTL
ncbi:MAG TPA: translation initiation factor IF-2 [bacterium]|nr:translation initiation factor IF-2 [bacterium]HOL94571.1 translation initiation factor IF-2 [bacterium]HPP01993.1 translation initiation factor IF-2 [bacterium]HXK94207.1 translation initiation factor IF-2 [bacterium]